MPATPAELRKAMGKFATGVTVALSRLEGQLYGMTANAVTSVSLEPPLILLCVGLERTFHGVLEKTRAFTLSILREDQRRIAEYFAGMLGDEGQPEELGFVEEGGFGHPRIANSIGWLDCRVIHIFPGGDHTIFVAQAERAGWTADDPLLFYQGQFVKLAAE